MDNFVAPEELTEEVAVNPKEYIELAEKDLNALSALCLAETMVYLFPQYFIIIWNLMKDKIHLNRDFSKLAIGIPRGFAKTTLMKIWIVYCVLFTTKKCMIVCSHNEEHAINIIRDVCSMLSQPNVVRLFGQWDINQERDQATCKIFAFRGRTIILGAIGARGSIRGLNIGNSRPDLIIFEDFQDRKESESDVISTALYKEMLGTFMMAASPFGCMYIFVANMYPTTGSVLKKLKNNPDWVKLIVGAILEDGSSLWEELHPIKQLISEYVSALNADSVEVFLAEKLNDETAGIKAGIDITKIPKFPYDDYEIPQGRAIVIDPALDNPKSDYNGIGLVGIYDGKPVLERALLGKYTPYDLIKKALLLGFETGARLICVENIAMQSTYLFWFNKISVDNGIDGFYFMPLAVGGYSKNAKIKTALQELMKGEVHCKQPVMPLLINEIIKWDPLKTKNQDTVMDLLTFCKKVQEQYSELMLMPDTLEMAVVAGAAPRDVSENCDF